MNTKYIFVTGGVVSSLGKGIISASIGKLLQARGYKICNQKFDPYINVDPGTLNPYEHGECYVTEDGFETDLDLGHYERFTGIRTTKDNSVTTGRIFQTVIEKERRGDYLGKTIQIVPHVTNEIKRRIKMAASEMGYDFVISEIGGTIGDIESAPFMEAIRQMKCELGRDVVFVHLAYVPYLKAAKEFKTKPTQHSVKEMQSLGIQPDILVLRTESHLEKPLLDKVAAFCNVDPDCVVQSENLPSIYGVPVNMMNQGLDRCIIKKAGLEFTDSPALGPWREFLDNLTGAYDTLRVGLVGKYDLQDAYKSIRESLVIAGGHLKKRVEIEFVDSSNITYDNVNDYLGCYDGIIIGPGFGQRGIEGKITAVNWARVNNVPCFGICLGMQMMVIEYARNMLGLADANSTEINPGTKAPVIDLMEDQKSISDMGGTMRLGLYECQLAPSKTRSIYGTETVHERHRHRYEFNERYAEDFEKAGMTLAGRNPRSGLVEVVELSGHRWFIGTQFHPEYSGTVLQPHPLFTGFVKACGEMKAIKQVEIAEIYK